MVQHLANRRTVTAAWDRYAALKKAVASDPVTAADPDQQAALARAHARWSQAFIAWDGK
jgi:hypothetical protein